MNRPYFRYEVIKRYAFIGRWYHLVRKYNRYGTLVATAMFSNERDLKKYSNGKVPSDLKSYKSSIV